MDSLELKPARRAAGTVRLPGSKSISNRVLLLAALAKGETEVLGLLDADDTRVMRDALSALGVSFNENIVKGVAGPFPVKKAELFLGNAGTAFRPLTAALAFSGGEYRLSGVPRMHERPIGDLVDALRGIGARVDYTGKQGFPPVAVYPSNLKIEKLRVRGDVSSQFLTALLMALPLSGKAARIEVQGELISKPYVEITLNVMQRFGVEVRRTGWRYFDVPAAAYRSPGKIHVEGDASSASYFLAAGAIGGGPVRVEGVGRGSIQGDVRFTEVLERMGATVSLFEDAIEVSHEKGKLKPIDLDLNHIPDAAMTAAVLALFADGPSTIRNVASWRVKETDRLAAMATELRKLGAQVEEGKDFLKIFPRELKANVAIDTYDDHRMAMSFSLASLGGVAVRINDPQCVAKTFPDFFAEFRENRRVKVVPVIAIDGPSASGKGTIAKRVAQALRFHYLESGALYRLVALLAFRLGLKEEGAIAKAAGGMDVVFLDDEILLEDQDVSAQIRHEEIGNRASEVARMPLVRQALHSRQRGYRQPPGLVADGRDMATVVFPDAALKIFLTASPEVRAQRRYKQLIEKGIAANLAALSRDLVERDARDANRPVAPLVPAADSQVLDSSALSIEEVVDRILESWRNKTSGGRA